MNSILESSVHYSRNVLFMGAPIRFVSYKVFSGCNIYHTTSVVRLRVNFGNLSEETSIIVDDTFSNKFLDRFLGLKSMTPKNGIKDDFIERLTSPPGVSFKEILLEAILAVETSVAFAMHDLYTVRYAAIQNRDNFTDLIWEYSSPRFSRRSAEVGFLGLVELLPKWLYSKKTKSHNNFESALNNLYTLAHRNRLAPSTSLIKREAKILNIPCKTLGAQHLVLGEGKLQHHMYASMADTTSIASQKLCLNKRQANLRLAELRLPRAMQKKVGSIDEAHAAAEKIGFPVAVKPVKGNKGRGVTAKVESTDEIEDAFKKAHKVGSDVLIEKYIPGDDYRLLVIDGKFLAAVKRIPPIITGDGVSTVEMLIDKLNNDPYRDRFRGFPVEKDLEVNRLLQQADLSFNDILESGRNVALRSAANVSTGGIPIDVTEQVHPDNREMALRSAAGVGLNIAGIDFITTDISKSYREIGGAIIEINARPGLDIHMWPKLGTSRNVANDVLKLVFPENNNSRIPIVTVAGDKGIGAPARILDMILRGSGRSVALVLRERSYLNGKPAEMSKTQQSKAVKLLLRDPDVETLVSTVSLRRATNRGLLLDECSLTIIMDKMIEENTKQFHDGLDIITQATTHCFVIGAENRIVLNRLNNTDRRRLILVSEQFQNPTLQSHLADGNCAVTKNWHNDKISILLLSGADILASFDATPISSRDGRIRKKRLTIAMMYAIAAAYGLGMSPPDISRAIHNAPDIIPDLNR